MLTILQIIISVVVVYLIFSVVVFVIVEWISSMLQLRGKMLKNAVLDLFRDEKLGKQIYHHPQVESLRAPNNKLTSYIPASSFASALIDSIVSRYAAAKEVKKTYDNFLESVSKLEEGHLKTLLTSLSQKSRDIDTLTESIEKWFSDCMDRVSGWYKRKTKTIIMIVAAVVTVSFNVDTVYIIRSAQADPILRQRLNELADQLVTDSTFTSVTVSVSAQKDSINISSVNASDPNVLQPQDQHGSVDSLASAAQQERLKQLHYLQQLIRESDLPIGWPVKEGTSWLYMVLGWFITTVALTAGAPFWFDILKKLVNLRSTGPKPTPVK
jgi:hypothetical protein